MICGYLSPDGVLYGCNRYEHTYKADKIVDELGIQRVKPLELGEDVLLKNGWICIRTSDVYKTIYDYNNKILFITDKQQEFFANNRDEFNKRQLADIEGLLKDFGKLYEWHKNDNT